LNINKFKTGKGDNSNIYKDLVKQKKGVRVQETIKNKIEEIKEKLSKYESMVQNLGKDFINNFNK
jgi:hypothetical protein